MVAGDLILDHYVWGKVDRISPEAPVVIVRVTEEERRLGGAGNVVRNLVSLGAKVSMCGVVGDDDNGREIIRLFASRGVDTSRVIVDSSRPTTVKTRVIAHAQQVVRVDREETSPISSALGEKLGAHLREGVKHCRGLIVSDYAKGTLTPEFFSVVSELAKSGSFGLQKLPLIIDPKAPNFSMYAGATVVKPNRGEAERASHIEISSRQDAVRAGEVLLEKWNCDMVLITLGEDGMALVSKLENTPKRVEIDTTAREVFDVSGAGDTVSAVFGLSLAVGADVAVAAELANLAAGIVVAEVGTTEVSLEELTRAIREQGKK